MLRYFFLKEKNQISLRSVPQNAAEKHRSRCSPEGTAGSFFVVRLNQFTIRLAL
jgi:hypothetical protein